MQMMQFNLNFGDHEFWLEICFRKMKVSYEVLHAEDDALYFFFWRLR